MLREVVYTPESEIRHPGRLLRRLASDLVASRELAWRLLLREIGTQYRQTLLGYAWAILPVLATSLVFIVLNASQVVTLSDTGMPYAAYVLIGTALFALFWESLTGPLRLFARSRDIVVKIYFPREALILASIGYTLFGLAVKVALLAVALGWLGVWPAGARSLLTVIPLMGLLFLGTALGVLLVPLGALFHDVAYGLTMMANGVMFLSPVVYAPPPRGVLAALVQANPLTPLIMAARDLLVTGASPYLATAVALTLGSLVLLLAASLALRVSLPILIERMGS